MHQKYATSHIDYALNKRQKTDFLRAMDLTEAFMPDTAAYPRPFHFWETDIWQKVTGMQLVRTKDGGYRFRENGKTLKGNSPIRSALVPVRLNIRADGRFTFSRTTGPSNIRIYYRPDPDLEEKALQQAYPLLLTSFKTQL